MTEVTKTHISKYAEKQKRNAAKVDNTKLVDNSNVKKNNESKTIVFNKSKEDDTFSIAKVLDKYPKHIVDVVIIIKQNAEIRRFTSLGILNYLIQKGEIKGNHRYVSFKWNKFVVKNNGLIKEFSYTEPFFVKCFIASFTSFSVSAQKIINIFCDKELKEHIEEITSAEDIENIVNGNEEYENNKASANP